MFFFLLLGCGKENNCAYNFVQTSCSHYGALIGSIVAFNVADIIGMFLPFFLIFVT